MTDLCHLNQRGEICLFMPFFRGGGEGYCPVASEDHFAISESELRSEWKDSAPHSRLPPVQGYGSVYAAFSFA
jgi:hypothetical protein